MQADDFAALRALFGSWNADAEALDGYRQAWSQPGALTAMLNYYRASPMHPPTAREPGVAALQLNPEDFRVRVPTQVIWGERDTAMLPGVLEGLDSCVPDLRIARIAEGSHWVVHECPERITELIRAFIAR